MLILTEVLIHHIVVILTIRPSLHLLLLPQPCCIVEAHEGVGSPAEAKCGEFRVVRAIGGSFFVAFLVLGGLPVGRAEGEAERETVARGFGAVQELGGGTCFAVGTGRG